MTIASTDHGSVLPPGSAALVVSDTGEFSLHLPDYGPDADVPRLVQLLAAILMRIDDETWIEDTLSVFDRTPRN